MSCALSIQNLEKIYPGNFQALKKVSFQVEKGDFFALLGPNGAGKTTLIGVLSSLVLKTSGKVFVFGKDIDSEFEIVKTFMGLVPQEFNFSVFETPLNILMNQGGYYGIPRALARERAETYLKKLELWDKRHVPSRMLSGGMKRRLMVARAFVHEPQLLILDEPTAGVDVETRQMMWAFLEELNRQGVTIILTTHYLEEAENLCRHVVIIDQGNIVENTNIHTLLGKLKGETFVLDLKEHLGEAPNLLGFPCRLLEGQRLEVDLSEGQTLNELYQALSKQKILVKSMRNKANRLETLFVRLINEGGQS